MAAEDPASPIRASLDPVLVPAGFADGQFGADDEGNVQVIFCAAHDDFSRRHPQLPQANQQVQRGACVDLVVDVRADGTLDRLEIEGLSVAETLLHAGLDALSVAVSQLDGQSAAESLPAIEAALRQLFRDPLTKRARTACSDSTR